MNAFFPGEKTRAPELINLFFADFSGKSRHYARKKDFWGIFERPRILFFPPICFSPGKKRVQMNYSVPKEIKFSKPKQHESKPNETKQNTLGIRNTADIQDIKSQSLVCIRFRNMCVHCARTLVCERLHTFSSFYIEQKTGSAFLRHLL